MTSAVLGFKKDEVYKLGYNNSDSYPSNLGIKVATFVQSLGSEKLQNIFNKIILVNRFSKSTVEEKIILGTDEWDYMEKTECKGDLTKYLNKMTYMADYKDWLEHIEYAYIINLNYGILEVYYMNNLKYSFPFRTALEEMSEILDE